ncbi:uncharacterized protein LOC117589259 [Drosophila guanche]|uniref:Uncharacterized protein n=1 Tax=Drosophila guanche TaxID=7266 RepID=A0A3B0KNQ9_DROGU|nr:uncharacterized protein LOC117589259 [Drosophila guanche]SPP87496.1 Hypothetical predicted protein [Drosophila guanche]
MQSFDGLSKDTLKEMFSSRVAQFKIVKGPNGHQLSSKCQEDIKKRLPAASYENVMAWVGSWIARLNGQTAPKQADQQSAAETDAKQSPPFVIDLCSDEDEDKDASAETDAETDSSADGETCQILDSLLASESSLSKPCSLIIHDDELGDINLQDYEDHIDGKLDVETLKKRAIKQPIEKRVSQTATKQFPSKLKGRTYQAKLKQRVGQNKISIGKALEKSLSEVREDRFQLKSSDGKAAEETITGVPTDRFQLKSNDSGMTTGKAAEEPLPGVRSDRLQLKSNDAKKITAKAAEKTNKNRLQLQPNNDKITISSDKAAEELLIIIHDNPKQSMPKPCFARMTVSPDLPPEQPTKTDHKSIATPKHNIEEITISPEREQAKPTIRVRSDLKPRSSVPAPLVTTSPVESPDSTCLAGNGKRKECDTTTEDGQSLAKRPNLVLERTNPLVYLQLPTVQLLLDQVKHFAIGQRNAQAVSLIFRLRQSLQATEQQIWNAQNLRQA